MYYIYFLYFFYRLGNTSLSTNKVFDNEKNFRLFTINKTEKNYNNTIDNNNNNSIKEIILPLIYNNRNIIDKENKENNNVNIMNDKIFKNKKCFEKENIERFYNINKI